MATLIRQGSTVADLGAASFYLPSSRSAFSRKFTVAIKPRVKTDVLKRRVCQCSRTTAGPVSRSVVPQEDGTQLLAVYPPALSRKDPAHDKAQTVDVVPGGNQHLDVLLGAVATARSVLGFVGNSKTRAKVDKQLTSLLSTIGKAFNHPTPPASNGHLPRPPTPPAARAHPPAGPAPPAASAAPAAPAPSAAPAPHPQGAQPRDKAPSMLEVEIRSLVDGAAAAAETTPATTVVVDRPTLVDSVTNFIRTREEQSRKVKEKLEENVADSESIQQSLLELQNSQAGRRSAKTADAASMAKLRKMQNETQQLQSQRGSGVQALSQLQADLGTLSASAKQLAEEQAQALSTPDVLKMIQVAAREGPVVEGAKTLEEKLGSLRALQGTPASASPSSVTAAAKAQQQKQEGGETVGQVLGMQVQLASLEAKLKDVTASRDALILANSQLRQHLTEVCKEKRVLGEKVQLLETSLAEAKRAVAVAQQRPSSSSSSSSSDNNSLFQLIANLTRERRPVVVPREKTEAVAKLEAELRVARESYKKYSGAIKWLKQRLMEMDGAANAEEEQLKSSLDFAQQRALEEEARVQQIEAKVSQADSRATQQLTELNHKVSALLSQTRRTDSSPRLRRTLSLPVPPSLSPVAGDLPSVPQLVRGAGLGAGVRVPSLGAGAAVPSLGTGMPVAGLGAPVPVAGSGAGVAVAGPGAVVSPGKEGSSAGMWVKGGAAPVKDSQGATVAKLTPMSQDQLKTYAWAVLPAFVREDVEGATGQQSGVDNLVKDLVRKGAPEAWARGVVQELLTTLPASRQGQGKGQGKSLLAV